MTKDPSNSPEHHVAMEVQTITSALASLCEMRRRGGELSDEVLHQEADLWGPFLTFSNLIEDIRAANDKREYAHPLVAAE